MSSTNILGFDANGGIEYMMMDARKLQADNENGKGYQRIPISSHIQGIADQWNINFYNPPHVSIRADGSRYIMDGNHTTKAAVVKMERETGNETTPVFILVRPYYNLTLTQEASYFIRFNSSNTPVNTNGKFRSYVAAGDLRANHINQAVEAAGFMVNMDTSASTSEKVGAVGGLYDVYDRGGFDHLRDTLITLHRCFGSDKKKFGKNMIIGMSLFLTDNPTIDTESFVNHVYTSEFTVRSVSMAASGLKKNCGANTNLWDEVARVLQTIADNASLTKHQLTSMAFAAPPARKPKQQKLTF